MYATFCAILAIILYTLYEFQFNAHIAQNCSKLYEIVHQIVMAWFADDDDDRECDCPCPRAGLQADSAIRHLQTDAVQYSVQNCDT